MTGQLISLEGQQKRRYIEEKPGRTNNKDKGS